MIALITFPLIQLFSFLTHFTVSARILATSFLYTVAAAAVESCDVTVSAVIIRHMVTILIVSRSYRLSTCIIVVCTRLQGVAAIIYSHEYILYLFLYHPIATLTWHPYMHEEKSS